MRADSVPVRPATARSSRSTAPSGVGSLGLGPPFAAARAAVEGEGAEAPFQERVARIAARGLATKPVEVGLIAVYLAAHAADASGAGELRCERLNARAGAAVVALD